MSQILSHIPSSMVPIRVSHWLNKDLLFSLVPLSQPKPDFYLYMDASLVGWGLTWTIFWHRDYGLLSRKEQLINVLELRAAWLALKSFYQVVSGNYSLLSTDNTTVAAYLNKEGGTFSDSVFHGYQAPNMVCQTTGVSDSPFCTREVQCSCRYPFEERIDNLYRVDTSYRHSVSDFSFLGSCLHRPVEKSTSGICISSTGPVS